MRELQKSVHYQLGLQLGKNSSLGHLIEEVAGKMMKVEELKDECKDNYIRELSLYLRQSYKAINSRTANH